MRISKDRKQRLYSAVDVPIMDYRLDILHAKRTGKGDSIRVDDLDQELFNIHMQIWKKVIKVLNLTD